MKVSLLTLGCKVNQAEMFDLESSLRMQGHEIVGLADSPDFCVVNTCTVTAKSDYQSRQLIRRAGRSGARVLVTGCYSELNREKVATLNGVHVVMDNSNKGNIIKCIDNNNQSNALKVRTGRARYFLKVQDGCNNSCSYCIVPKARGLSRSIPLDEVIDAVGRAVDSGYQEVVLTGVHLGQYCSDKGGESFSGLVDKILLKTKVSRLRLSSLEVNEVDERLLELFEDPRLMRHLHIPLQSGDDGVLRLMNRAYDTAFFRDAIMRIHERLPGTALGTDVIAGFPQESEKAFRNTYCLIEDLPFTYLHVFPYSKRPGTPAAYLQDIVGPETRKKRASSLRAISGLKKAVYMNQQVGRVLGVLIEDVFKGLQCRGTSDNYLKVLTSGSAQAQGSIVPVRIVGVSGEELIGEPLRSQQSLDSYKYS